MLNDTVNDLTPTLIYDTLYRSYQSQNFREEDKRMYTYLFVNTLLDKFPSVAKAINLDIRVYAIEDLIEDVYMSIDENKPYCINGITLDLSNDSDYNLKTFIEELLIRTDLLDSREGVSKANDIHEYKKMLIAIRDRPIDGKLVDNRNSDELLEIMYQASLIYTNDSPNEDNVLDEYLFQKENSERLKNKKID